MGTRIHRNSFAAVVAVMTATALLGGGVASAAATTAPVANATFTYPTAGQANVDATNPFTWTVVPGAQGYAVAVGTTAFGTDVAQSGVLPATQTAFVIPAMPTGKKLFATLLTEQGGTWGFSAVTFTPVAGDAFTHPTDGQTNVDVSKPLTWSTIPDSQGAILVLGFTKFSDSIYNSGLLPAAQDSFTFPPGLTGHVYATLLTKTNGGYTRFQEMSFTAAPAHVTIVNDYPLSIQLSLDNQNFVLASGQQVGPVEMIAPAPGNDNTNISVVGETGCGVGDDYDFFDSGQAYTFTIVASGGTCANGTVGPNFVITAR
jgi:hypothetical protein